MRIVLVIFYLFLIFIGASFAALNSESVKINLFFTHFQLPLSVLVIISIMFGVLLSAVVLVNKILKMKLEQNKLRHQLNLTEKEIRNLRAIPLKDGM